MPPKPLSQMTVGEVKAYQRQLLNDPRNHKNSSAVGRYQIVGKTLRGLQRNMGISDNEIFSPQLQDRLAQEILRENGLGKYQSGKMSATELQERIARQWASVAHPASGRGTQGLGTTTEQIQQVIRGLPRRSP
jgi:muramidase (phage lysozyme)